jgi:glucose/arabinose dehydrogenase
MLIDKEFSANQFMMMNFSTARSRTFFLVLIVIMLIVGSCSIERLVNRMSNKDSMVQQQPSEWGFTNIELRGDRYTAYHPENFTLEFLGGQMKSPRMMNFNGDQLFVGSKSGYVYRLDPPYHSATPITKLSGYPHSALVRGDKMYIARTIGVFVADYNPVAEWIDESDFKQLVELPGGKGHSSRTLKTGPDSGLYVSIGIQGNCSNQYLDLSYSFNDRRGGIFLIDESDNPAKLAPFASGLRNPVGFDWHPESGVMYAANNGPDHLGYGQPPEYFSRLDQGSFHGMPWFQYDGEKLVRDDCVDFDPPRSIDQVSIPVATFPAHIAPLGVTFVTDQAKAVEFAGDAIVAFHGSWVTSDGTGKGEAKTRRHPKLALVNFENGEVSDVRDLLTGFQLPDGNRWARPADVAIGPDGDIYFTSDGGVQGLYRLKKM